MDEVIQDYCTGNCKDCVIDDVCDDCDGMFEGNLEVCERAYNKIMELKGTTETAQTHDVVNHPSHYTHGGMECIDEMTLLFGREAVKHFCLCNAWKYRARCLYKNGEEDLKKSDWYIKKYKELVEETPNE